MEENIQWLGFGHQLRFLRETIYRCLKNSAGIWMD
jgi:hypothetical protein